MILREMPLRSVSLHLPALCQGLQREAVFGRELQESLERRARMLMARRGLQQCSEALLQELWSVLAWARRTTLLLGQICCDDGAQCLKGTRHALHELPLGQVVHGRREDRRCCRRARLLPVAACSCWREDVTPDSRTVGGAPMLREGQEHGLVITCRGQDMVTQHLVEGAHQQRRVAQPRGHLENAAEE